MDRTASKIIWSPYTKGYFNNPYIHLKECREQNPIHKGIHKSWMFFTYSDVNSIIRSNEFEASELSKYLVEKEPYIFKNTDICPYLSKGTQQWPMYLNGNPHKNSRAIMGKSLHTADLTTIITDAVHHTNHKYQDSTAFDLVNYCGYFIFLVTQKLFGFKDSESYEDIKKYSNMLARSQDLFIPKQVYTEINSWFLWGKDIFPESIYKENITKLSEDLGLNYTDDDIYSILSISTMAAFETSKDNLTIALYEILKDPKLIPSIVDSNTKGLHLLIEELFRYSSPLQYTVRVNKKEFAHNEITIPANSKLYLCLASANRDPEKFENPDSIIPDRQHNEHLAFGGGNHFCLGAQIARQEMRLCLQPMVQFLKNYTIDESENIKWGKQIFMRTVEALPLIKKPV